MSQKKSKKWPELGIIVKNQVKDKEGNPVIGKDGQPVYKLGFKLAENVTVLVDGEPVQLNKGRTGMLVSPVEEVDNLIKRGVIGEDKAESRREQAKEVNSWLRYKIQLPPPRD